MALGISTVSKITINRPRPYTTYPSLIFNKGKVGDHSFPSGHTTAAFATATSLSLAFPKWYVIAPSYAYAAAIAYSRMYLGVHYPTDVLGGIISGAGSSLFVFHARKWLNKRKSVAPLSVIN
jgi:membrane-associated phospholipid phosphatase